jgi:hypothetical protein
MTTIIMDLVILNGFSSAYWWKNHLAVVECKFLNDLYGIRKITSNRRGLLKNQVKAIFRVGLF